MNSTASHTESQGAMEIQVYDKRRVLRNFASYLPLLIWGIVVYWLLGMAVLTSILKSCFGIDKVGAITAPIVAVVVIAAAVVFVNFIVSRVAKSRLSLEGDVLSASGHTSRGLQQRQWTLTEITSVRFGEPLNTVERVGVWMNKVGVPRTGAIGLAQTLKAGRLIISSTAGAKVVFRFVDKVFDPSSLLRFVAELRQRGVQVQGEAYVFPILAPSAPVVVGGAIPLPGSNNQSPEDSTNYQNWLESLPR